MPDDLESSAFQAGGRPVDDDDDDGGITITRSDDDDGDDDSGGGGSSRRRSRDRSEPTTPEPTDPEQEAFQPGGQPIGDEGDPDETTGAADPNEVGSGPDLDPERGTATTDRLRPDAESDPMNGQTEPTRLDDDPEQAAFRAGGLPVDDDDDGITVTRTDRGEQPPGRIGADEFERRAFEAGRRASIDAVPVSRRIAEATEEQAFRRAQRGPRATTAEEQLEQQLEQQVAIARNAPAVFAGERVAATGTAGVDLVRGEDFRIRRTPTGITAETTEAFERAEARRMAEIEFEELTGVDLDPETDIEFTDGQATLTDRGSARVEGEGAEQFGDIELRLPEETTRPSGFGLQGVPSEPDGRFQGPVTVDRPPTADVPFGGERVETALAFGSSRVSGFFEDLTQPIEEADEGDIVLESEIAVALGEDHPRPTGFGQQAAPTEPTGQLQAAEPAERPPIREGDPDLGERVRSGLGLAVETGGQFANVPALALSGKELVEFGVEAGSRTLDTDVRTERRLTPRLQGAPVASEPGFQGPTTVDQPPTEVDEPIVDFSREAGAAAIDLGESGVEFARDRPVDAAIIGGASLVGSAAIMGAARRIGPRAGVASRFAIQPGEEILGRGGFAATRRIADEPTAQRLFPRQEPLIFSEEFAIRQARRGALATRRGAGQLRTSLGELDRPSPSRLAESAAIEARSLPANIAIARFNLGRRLRGESTAFRQAAVRGELESGDINLVETDGIDVPTRGAEALDDPPSGAGVGRVGGSFDLEIERRTDSGVVVERVRSPIAFETRTELEAEFDRAQATRPSVRTELIQPEVTGVDPIAGGEPRLTLDLTQELGQDLEFGQELEPGQDLELTQEFELGQEFEFGQELEFGQEFEFESEFEFEFEGESEIELETDLEERDRRDPDEVILGRRPGWARELDRSLINPFTGE